MSLYATAFKLYDRLSLQNMSELVTHLAELFEYLFEGDPMLAVQFGHVGGFRAIACALRFLLFNSWKRGTRVEIY